MLIPGYDVKHYRLFLTILALVSPKSTFAEIFVVDGDPQAFVEAIEQSNEDGGGLIRIHEDIYFPPGATIPPITGLVTIEGQSVFRDEDPSETLDRLFLIEPNGELEIDGIQFEGFGLGRPSPSQPLIENFGRLDIRNAVFRDINGVSTNIPRFGGPKGRELMINHADLLIRGSVFDDVAFFNQDGGLLINLGSAVLSRVHFYQGEYLDQAPFRNTGDLTLVNVTMIGGGSESGRNVPIWNNLGDFKIANSIFEGFADGWCENVISLGYNLVADAGCGFGAPGDLVNQPSGLLPLREEPFNPNSHLTIPTRKLSASSVAIDSANPSYCDASQGFPSTNSIDGDLDGNAVCDRGAFEYVPANLTTGGITGLYYDPNADGHYVQILQTDYNTLVTWNTVDRDGLQAWVYGVGDLVTGQSVTAAAYINYGGRLTNDGPIDIDDAQEWGTIQVEMESCLEGRVLFDSGLANFGSGSFEIRRLAFSKQISCQQ